MPQIMVRKAYCRPSKCDRRPSRFHKEGAGFRECPGDGTGHALRLDLIQSGSKSFALVKTSTFKPSRKILPSISTLPKYMPVLTDCIKFGTFGNQRQLPQGDKAVSFSFRDMVSGIVSGSVSAVVCFITNSGGLQSRDTIRIKR